MIENTLSRLGIQYSLRSGQIVIDCPFCDRPMHLYVDPQKQVFYCQRCGRKGPFTALLTQISGQGISTPFAKKAFAFPSEAYIQACEKRLLGPNGQHAVEYLYSRTLTIDAIHYFRLGLEVNDGKEWLVIPYLKDGRLVNAKYRTMPPAEKEFRRWAGGESILFNQDCLKGLGDDEEILIAEGEFDCMALWSQGFKNSVATTVGANGIKPGWVDQLERFARINIAYDADGAGQKGAYELARRLGDERCFNIVLPAKDVNDFFMTGGDIEAFGDLIARATRFDVENIATMEKVFENLLSQSDEVEGRGAVRPLWRSVERLTGPYGPGDLIVVSGPPKTGKTTFTLNDALAAAKMGTPVLFYCLEMRPERLLRKVFQIELARTEGELTPDMMRKAFSRLVGTPLAFGHNYRKCSLDIVVETIRRGARRFGFGLAVFDNLHFLARSITHQVQEVGVISKTFKLLAEELHIPIVLIAQPRKINDDRVMGIEDLKDSSAIGADADCVIVLYRRRRKSTDGAAETAFEPETLVRVDASRFRAGGETVLYYDGATARFTELEKKRA